MKESLQKFASRKFILALAFSLLVVLNKKLELNLTAEDLTTIGTAVLGYLAAEGLVDLQKVRKTTEKAIETVKEVKEIVNEASN